MKLNSLKLFIFSNFKSECLMLLQIKIKKAMKILTQDMLMFTNQ